MKREIVVILSLWAAACEDPPDPPPACQVPVGAFQVTGHVVSASATCVDVPMSQLTQTLILDGTPESLVDPGCMGTAKRSENAQCEYVVVERCEDGSEIKFTMVIETSDYISSVQTTVRDACVLSIEQSAERMSSDDTGSQAAMGGQPPVGGGQLGPGVDPCAQAASKFIANNDGTVRGCEKGKSALAWQQRADTGLYDLMGAKNYCARLSLAGGGWRVPEIDELQKLKTVPFNGAPAILTNFFPGTLKTNFWSATLKDGDPQSAWTVEFKSGGTIAMPVIAQFTVRCVR